jgi:hypothetical protein
MVPFAKESQIPIRTVSATQKNTSIVTIHLLQLLLAGHAARRFPGPTERVRFAAHDARSRGYPR